MSSHLGWQSETGTTDSHRKPTQLGAPGHLDLAAMPRLLPVLHHDSFDPATLEGKDFKATQSDLRHSGMCSVQEPRLKNRMIADRIKIPSPPLAIHFAAAMKSPPLASFRSCCAVIEVMNDRVLVSIKQSHSQRILIVNPNTQR